MSHYHSFHDIMDWDPQEPEREMKLIIIDWALLYFNPLTNEWNSRQVGMEESDIPGEIVDIRERFKLNFMKNGEEHTKLYHNGRIVEIPCESYDDTVKTAKKWGDRCGPVEKLNKSYFYKIPFGGMEKYIQTDVESYSLVDEHYDWIGSPRKVQELL